MQLCSSLGIQQLGNKIFSDIVSRYSESHRCYHTLGHVMYCLDEFERVRHATKIPEAVEMAIWFHDAVYVMMDQDNEVLSAKLFLECMLGADLPRVFLETVADLILATRHGSAPCDPECKLVADIDLAILAQSEEVYDAYEEAIWQEYSCLPRRHFLAGRQHVLWKLLTRKSIYQTQIFRRNYEAAARHNLARTIMKSAYPAK